MYTVKLLQTIISRRLAFHVCLSRQIELPFEPSKDIVLGLYAWSKFSSDAARVDRILWQHHEEAFHAELKEICTGNPIQTSKWHILNGWELALWTAPVGETAESFADEMQDWSCIVQIGKAYYHLDVPEICCLRQEGVAFNICDRGKRFDTVDLAMTKKWQGAEEPNDD